MKIGIVGNGFVGSAIIHGFVLHVEDILICDTEVGKSTHTLEEISEQADIAFVCVPTPMFESGEIDLSIVEGVVRQICSFENRNKDMVVVIKSTVVPGTVESLANIFPQVHFVFNPEFLTERRARLDFINTSRVVLGGNSEFALNKVEELYRLRFPYVKIIKTDFGTSQLIKYMANCFFATKVSFMNEMKQVCDAIDGDWDAALSGFISDGRIGNSHIDVPGHDGSLGFGGKCFPKDLNAMITRSKELGVDPKVMMAAWEKNLEVRKDLDWLRIKGAVSK